MLAAFLRLALLGGFKVGLSSALPAFLRKASSCIVFPTRSLLTMQRHERPQDSWAHERRAPFWVPSVNIPRAPGADLRVAFGSPWKLPVWMASRFSRRDGGAECPSPQRLRGCVLVLGARRLLGKSQCDIPPPAHPPEPSPEASSSSPGVQLLPLRTPCPGTTPVSCDRNK